jgi:lipopolysaccharide export system protein LptC
MLSKNFATSCCSAVSPPCSQRSATGTSARNASSTSLCQVDESAIDWYATNAHSVQFLPDGKVQYEMTSDKVEHLKATKSPW